MSKLLKELNLRLDALGAVNSGSDLVGGTIYWTNEDDQVVAYAKVKAILSWAATNNSAMWAYAIGQFQDAGVSCLEPQGIKGDYISNINDEQAAEWAEKVAIQAQAQYLYRATNGANGLYLAVFDWVEGSKELTPADFARRRRSAIGYVVQMLSNIAEILGQKKREQDALALLQHFYDALQQQLDKVLREEDLREETLKLQKSIEVWKEMLRNAKRKEVLAFMKQAASKWARMKDS